MRLLLFAKFAAAKPPLLFVPKHHTSKRACTLEVCRCDHAKESSNDVLSIPHGEPAMAMDMSSHFVSDSGSWDNRDAQSLAQTHLTAHRWRPATPVDQQWRLLWRLPDETSAPLPAAAPSLHYSAAAPHHHLTRCWWWMTMDGER